MKTKLLLVVSLFLAACASQGPAADDGYGADAGVGSDSGSDAGTPPACQKDTDCNDDVACTTGVCQTDGTCRFDATCSSDEVCNERTDACETPVPTGHAISCSQTGNTLSVTVHGKLTDAVFGGSLAHPAYVALASDQIAGSWNPSATSSGPRIDLSPSETSGGYVNSGPIDVPSGHAQRFTLLAWSNDDGGYWRRVDLSAWDVSGDGCAKIADGSTDGSTDGFIIGRAPRCPDACDDGDDATVDSCQATVNPATNNGCWHVGNGGGTTVGNGKIDCVESGSNTIVTISGGVLDHLFFTVSPTTDWHVRFGYGGTSSKPWVSDAASYSLTMPNSVHGFSFTLQDPAGTDYWFDVNEFDVSGTCSLGTGEFIH